MTTISKIPFGNEGPPVTRVGLGGEGVLRTWGASDDARGVIKRALDEGITYCDSARVYAGSESYYGSIWSEDPEARSRVFQTSKSASRDREGAMSDLQTTLATLATDHLDLWQIHDVRTRQDLDVIERNGGALETFLEAREEGLVRHIGVTGHHDPDILLEALRRWPVDSVLLPVNPVEGVLGGFTDRVIPEARERGLAVIAMKVLGGRALPFTGRGDRRRAAHTVRSVPRCHPGCRRMLDPQRGQPTGRSGEELCSHVGGGDGRTGGCVPAACGETCVL